MLAWTRLDSLGLAWEEICKWPLLSIVNVYKLARLLILAWNNYMLAWTRLDSFGLAWENQVARLSFVKILCSLGLAWEKGARSLCFIKVNIGLDLILLCINQAS